MGTIEINGMTMIGVTPEQELILRGRDNFVKAYCAEKGWGTLESLTIPQIMEIRSQDGWKNPAP